ncbi:glycoside hydrolase family 88 protein [Mangrovibacterium diazotrophicum]|uniref:Unsaturated chondroitin disaccharide hydrolase n=1 Tax=Mangrovibacterium diazotrophicum TaxID=1261403 RepID=A0A419W4G0_9BACT|nr:glycoside hydrolase family 88 protein [Mangrovibacterium diazotrophicum]RKD90339.1 unsaturated chondroitin disaccharide hydrolase [Mangrovibacterium diazotrophicum]
MKNKILIIPFFWATVLVSSCSHESKMAEFLVQKELDYCVGKAESTAKSLDDYSQFPRNILDSETQWNTTAAEDWTSGFWPGIAWYAYEESGDSILLETARKYTESVSQVLLAPQKDHDLGFIFYCSYGNGYRLTGDKTYKEVLLQAADSLAELFNPKVGTILSWPYMVKAMGWPHNTIIDNMMNLELLFWAAKNGGNKELYEIADSHARHCMNTLVRPDSTTFHVAVFDTLDGHFIKGVTHQGYSDSSMWARGQTWGIYGYTVAYRETGDEQFLNVAEKLADKFLQRLPADGIPFWDFDAPVTSTTPKDASAATIAASALLELSTLEREDSRKQKYFNAAVDLLTRLSSADYQSGDRNKAMLVHSTGHFPAGGEIDASIIYADYYYIEALSRLKKMRREP